MIESYMNTMISYNSNIWFIRIVYTHWRFGTSILRMLFRCISDLWFSGGPGNYHLGLSGTFEVLEVRMGCWRTWCQHLNSAGEGGPGWRNLDPRGSESQRFQGFPNFSVDWENCKSWCKESDVLPCIDWLIAGCNSSLAILFILPNLAMHFSFAMSKVKMANACSSLRTEHGNGAYRLTLLCVTCWQLPTICGRREVQNVSKSRMMNRSLWRHLRRETTSDIRSKKAVSCCFHIFPSLLELHFDFTSSMALGH